MDSTVCEAIDYRYDTEPIMANASKFSEHWSHWGKCFFSLICHRQSPKRGPFTLRWVGERGATEGAWSNL